MRFHLVPTILIAIVCCTFLPDGCNSKVDDRLEDREHHTPDTLIVFESDKKYYIDVDKGNVASKLRIPNKNFHWNKKETAKAVAKMKVGHAAAPVCVYMLTLGDVNSWNWHVPIIRPHSTLKTKRLALNVVMPDREVIYDNRAIIGRTAKYIDRPVLEWSSSFRMHPDYAIISRQRVFEKPDHNGQETMPEGYVVHQDQFHKTGQFIMYDLVIHHASLRMDIQMLPRVHKDDSIYGIYHYIQRTEKPNEVVLLHKDKIAKFNESERSLFTKLPVGYRYDKFTLFFDTALGCVYKMQFDTKLSAVRVDGKPQSYMGHRINIPYEKFFVCDQTRFPLSPKLKKKFSSDRCETNYIGYKNPDSTESSTTSHDNANRSGLLTVIIAMGAILVIVLSLVGLCLFLVFRGDKGKKKKNEEEPAIEHYGQQPGSSAIFAAVAMEQRRTSPKVVADRNLASDNSPHQERPAKKERKKKQSAKRKKKVIIEESHSSIIESTDHRQKDEQLPTTSVFNPELVNRHHKPKAKKRKNQTPAATMSTVMSA